MSNKRVPNNEVKLSERTEAMMRVHMVWRSCVRHASTPLASRMMLQGCSGHFNVIWPSFWTNPPETLMSLAVYCPPKSDNEVSGLAHSFSSRAAN
jgi:hypothetical protein